MSILRYRLALAFFVMAAIGNQSSIAAVFYFPQVGDGVTEEMRFQTSFIFVNSDGDSAIRLEFFDSSGNPMTLTLGSLGTQSRFELTLKQGESVSVQTPGTDGIQVGYAKVTAGSGVGGTAVFTGSDLLSGTVLYEAGVPAATPSTDFGVFLDSLANKDTGLALVNPSAANAAPQGAEATITIRLYDTSFNLIAVTSIKLASGRHRAKFIHEFFADFPDVAEQAREFQGVLTVQSDTALVAVTLRRNDAPGLKFPAEVPTLTAFPVIRGRADQPPRLALMCAVNLSSETLCAEEDNVNVPMLGAPSTFRVEATHPTYVVGADNCLADFTDCEIGSTGDFSFDPIQPSECPDIIQTGLPGESACRLFDDGITIVVAVRKEKWWRPSGMTASVAGRDRLQNIHSLRVSRKISGADSWPQFFVIYQDGNFRLKPHPPAGANDVCFGSSVLVGPAPPADRPFAEIRKITYTPDTQNLQVEYALGGSANFDLSSVDRTKAKVDITVDYPTDPFPFVTLRSMYVAEDNADASRVDFLDLDSTLKSDSILGFIGACGQDWFFHRPVRSRHNTSAPDIRITRLP